MVKIVETKMKAIKGRSKRKLQQQHHPITKKKLKQMTLLDTFAKSPRVLVSPLRLPLDVLKNNSSRNQQTVNVKDINPVDATLLKSTTVIEKNENTNLTNGTSKIAMNPVPIKKVWPKPQPTLVCLPNGLKNSDFGEALFICQFLVDFSKALEIPVTFEISTDNLIKAVAQGSEGFEYISSILLIFLTAASSNSKKNIELGLKISDVIVTSYSAPEVARLFLINDNIIKYKEDMKVLLTTKEFHELEPSALMEVLSCLCEIAVKCQVVRCYVDEIEEQRLKFYRKRHSIVILEKKLNEKTQLLKEKDQLKEQDQPKTTDQALTEQEVSPLEKTTLSTNSFYGDNSLGAKTQRQIMAEKSRLEKAQAESEKRARSKAEYEISKMELTVNKFTADMKKTCDDYQNLLRLKPIGTDGDDNRYWWFNHNSLHLVVEKNWRFNENNTSSDWYTFDCSQHSQLLKALDSEVEKERSLKTILKKKTKEEAQLKTETENPTNESIVLTDNWNEKSIQSLKEDMRNLQEFITEDMLAGWMLDFESWRKRLSNADNVLQMRNLLMDTYKCLHGSCVKKINLRFPLEKWVNEVEKCNSFSRMHFLVTVLRTYFTNKTYVGLDEPSSAESSVSEDENSEDVDQGPIQLKCSRCKRGDGDLFECIECSVAFHLKCYRPQLRHPPRAWVCDKCKRHETTRRPTSLPVSKPKIIVKPRSSVKQSRPTCNEEGRRRSPRIRE